MWSTDLPTVYNLDAIRAFLAQNFWARYQIEESDLKFTVRFNDWIVQDRFVFALTQQNLFD